MKGRDVVSPDAGASDGDQKEQNAPEGAKKFTFSCRRLFPNDACRIGQDAAFQKKRIRGLVSKQIAKLRFLEKVSWLSWVEGFYKTNCAILFILCKIVHKNQSAF